MDEPGHRRDPVMAGEVAQPHDRLFRSVFGEKTEAAGLLRAHLPEAVAASCAVASRNWR